MKARHHLEKWAVENLVENEQQARFGNLADPDFQALVESIEQHGLRDPLVILPDGTILAGHQRLRAVKQLGWERVDVIVRHDLADDPMAAEEYFIESNLHRRQMNPIMKANCVLRLSELKFGASPRDLEWSQKEDAKKWVGQRLGCCSRQVDRLLLASKAPPLVQTALEQGLLDLILAGKVAMAEPSAQHEIADAINATCDDETLTCLREQRRAVIHRVQEILGLKRETTDNDLKPFVNELKKFIPKLEASLTSIDSKTIASYRPILERARETLAALLKSPRQREAGQP